MRLSTLAAFSVIASAVAFQAEAQAAKAAPDGKQLFTTRCAMCHAATPTGGPPIGPTLYGVVGRKVGTTTFKYSKALPATGVTWDAASLDKYLTNPQAFAPGAFMPISVPAAEDRKAIIAYLGTLGAAPAKAVPAKAETAKKPAKKG